MSLTIVSPWIVEFPFPLGYLQLTLTPQGVRSVAFKEAEALNKPILPRGTGEIHYLSALQKQLERYFSGKRVDFSEIPLDIAVGTPFQQQVWKTLQHIPYGTVKTYGWVAQQLQNPKAMRAVGQANGCNPIPILIPCHRVVAAHGQLGGYLKQHPQGPAIKRLLLSLEGWEITPHHLLQKRL